ncbi:MAG: SWIM zinc finger domain-containing protein [Candidatus Obscuribacterales bacterium]|nr:SWIM zinc finger domain-containing protein [Candidatus Obscuribacterales bacterium]
MAATVNLDYSYLYASTLASENDSKRSLRLATSGGAERNPYFFQGRIISPKQTADLLLTLSAISRTRFFSPGEIRERMLNAADPVVTSDGGRLRFEVFSVCCGAYARLDLQPDALDAQWIGKGTTNIDFNPPMRASLATVLNSENVALNIGADKLELERSGESVIERKVKLPLRWLKGFVEVQVYQSALKQVMEIPALELAKMIRTLPPQNFLQAGTISYLIPASKGFRLSQRDAAGAVPVGAISRLRALEPILRYAKSVKIYSSSDAISAFELIFTNGKFFFVLSPNAARGFSGEGQALSALASNGGVDALAHIRSALAWQEEISVPQLSSSLEMSAKAVEEALQVLGTRGLVGYDLSAGAYFHRELPFDLGLVEELHPRMKKARELLEQRLVRYSMKGDDEVEAYVKGSAGDHYVQMNADGARCTCDWFAKNQGNRGPCSHILAAELAVQEDEPNAFKPIG